MQLVKWQKTEFDSSVVALVLNSYILYMGFKKTSKKLAFLRTCPVEALYQIEQKVFPKLKNKQIKISQGPRSLKIQKDGKANIREQFNDYKGVNRLPRCLSGEEFTCPCRTYRRCGFNPCVGKNTWGIKWKSIPVFLPGESHGQRSLAGYSPQGHKELDTTATEHARELMV